MLGLAAIVFVLTTAGKDSTAADVAPRTHGMTRLGPGWRRAGLVGIVVGLVGLGVGLVAPTHVSRIRLRFLSRPDFDQYAFVYLIYELNKLQKSWYFEVDFDQFSEAELTDAQRSECQGDRTPLLCYGEALSGGQPFIGITSDSLGLDFFSQNRGSVSVISTYGWPRARPPGVYDFLAYSMVVQSIAIHLNTYCHGLPEGSLRRVGSPTAACSSSHRVAGRFPPCSPRISAVRANNCC